MMPVKKVRFWRILMRFFSLANERSELVGQPIERLDPGNGLRTVTSASVKNILPVRRTGPWAWAWILYAERKDDSEFPVEDQP
jgi:hypothetical protein